MQWAVTSNFWICQAKTQAQSHLLASQSLCFNILQHKRHQGQVVPELGLAASAVLLFLPLAGVQPRDHGLRFHPEHRSHSLIRLIMARTASSWANSLSWKIWSVFIRLHCQSDIIKLTNKKQDTFFWWVKFCSYILMARWEGWTGQ